MIYPTVRFAWFALAGALPALMVALALPAHWTLGLIGFVALIVFGVIDITSAAPMTAAGVDVDVPRTLPVGGEGVIHVQPRFATAVTAPRRVESRLGLDDRLMPRHGATLVTGPGQTGSLTVRAERRGQAPIDRLWMRWHGPFGLMWKQRVLALDRSVAILPDIAAARDEAMAAIGRQGREGSRLRYLVGGGREFDALVDYQPGMGRRSIDWKRSARHTRLLAREYRAEQNNRVVLAIDCGRLMGEPVEGVAKVDRAVAAALAIAVAALADGDQVSLFAFDARPRVASGAVRGLGSFALLQQRAAGIDYATEESNFTLALTTLAGQLDRRALVLVFSDFVDTIGAQQMLNAIGRLTDRHLVLFVLMGDQELEAMADADPADGIALARAVVAGELLEQRELVMRRLAQLGVEVLAVPWRQLGPRLIARYQALKDQDRL